MRLCRVEGDPQSSIVVADNKNSAREEAHHITWTWGAVIVKEW
jgi:hypothetical protein